MNEEARIELDRILAIDPADLTEAERGFLQARRSYLTEEQRIKFDISEHAVAVSSDASEESEASEKPAARKGRQAKAE